jgi:hypothetical protein
MSRKNTETQSGTRKNAIIKKAVGAGSPWPVTGCDDTSGSRMHGNSLSILYREGESHGK